jgi:hypothetical protein
MLATPTANHYKSQELESEIRAGLAPNLGRGSDRKESQAVVLDCEIQSDFTRFMTQFRHRGAHFLECIVISIFML